MNQSTMKCLIEELWRKRLYEEKAKMLCVAAQEFDRMSVLHDKQIIYPLLCLFFAAGCVFCVHFLKKTARWRRIKRFA
jgi:hypothetical protein